MYYLCGILFPVVPEATQTIGFRFLQPSFFRVNKKTILSKQIIVLSIKNYYPLINHASQKSGFITESAFFMQNTEGV